jgi:hypothetical protein
MTAVQLAALRGKGPVLRFDAATPGGRRATMPVIANLFGTPDRVAAGLGLTLDEVPAFGDFLAALRSPAPVEGMRDALSRWPVLKAALQSRPKLMRKAPAQEVAAPPDLSLLPVQTPWPGDAGPLITWPVVVTRPHGSEAGQVSRYNLGVYRAQVIGARPADPALAGPSRRRGASPQLAAGGRADAGGHRAWRRSRDAAVGRAAPAGNRVGTGLLRRPARRAGRGGGGEDRAASGPRPCRDHPGRLGPPRRDRARRPVRRPHRLLQRGRAFPGDAAVRHHPPPRSHCI